MKVPKEQFDSLLKRLLAAKPETAKTIAKPKPEKTPTQKPSR
jgi:hypothetical protein